MKNNFCTFYIIRHGETRHNVNKIMQGHTDSSLTPKGLDQAKKAAQILKSVKFDRAYSSDLLRAQKTAEIIALEHKLAVESAQLLRERKWGRFEGKPQQLGRDFYKLADKLDHAAHFRHKIDPDVESDEEITTRLITFLREAALAHPGKTILVVTHGGIMRAFLIHLGVMSYDNPKNIYIGNTGYIKVASDGVDFFIKEVKGLSEGGK